MPKIKSLDKERLKHDRIIYKRHYDKNKKNILLRNHKYYLKHKNHLHKQQVERMKKYRQTEIGRKCYNAHQKIARYLKLGKLKKKPCIVCNNPQSQAHHPHGYDNALDIQWLCDIHHKEIHREFRRNIEKIYQSQ